MQNNHIPKTNINYVCVFSIAVFDLIAIAIEILLFINLLTSKQEDMITFFLQLEILLSCLFHQISYTPTYLAFIDTKFKEIVCNSMAFINNTTNISTMMFGVIISYLLLQCTRGKPINSFFVIVISSLCWFFSFFVSLLFFIFGKIDIDLDTVCWFQDLEINILILIINFILCIVTTVFITKMILVINQTFKIMNADDNFGGYKSRMKQF